MNFERRIFAVLPLAVFILACGSRPVVELREIAHFNTKGWSHDLAIDRNLLYVADRQGGYLVFNTAWGYRNPRISIPVKDVVSLSPNGGAPVLASRFEGLVVVSHDGAVTGRFSNGDIANAVEVRDGLAYAAYGLRGLVVVRVAGGHADLVSDLPTTGWSHDLRLLGSYALLADWNGLRVVDIRDPAAPVQTGFLKSSATCISLAVEDRNDSPQEQRIALAEGHGGIALVRLDGNGQPALISRYDLGLNPSAAIHPKSGGWVHSVAWAGRYLVAANWKSGLAVLDMADARNPRLVLQYPTSGTSLGVKAVRRPDGKYLVFLADGESGLRVFVLATDNAEENRMARRDIFNQE